MTVLSRQREPLPPVSTAGPGRRASEIASHTPALNDEPLPGQRVRVGGKFLRVGDHTFYVRGVTYGTFCGGEDEIGYRPDLVERDFAAMASAGINAVRVYTVPPGWLLDAALAHGLRVMVGLPWEEHVTFLDDRATVRAIEERVRAGVRACAGHPAVLCYAIGNEIPAPIVRWHGARRVEGFLARLAALVRAEDPGALVTYVNYPSTEYLQLDFVDIVSFNVYLETRDQLESYLARLQNVAGDRPLLIAETGLDSRRNGQDAQAEVLSWQISSIFRRGGAGLFVYAWTDEWFRGGQEIVDWDFGLVTRDRMPKPALTAVRTAFSDVPFPARTAWPMVSVVVCSQNGAATLRDCLDGLARLAYPRYEVIVVDDGSTDETASIARDYPVRLIQTENRGLSAARNTGLHVATGEIIAYTDDDARPDPHWLHYLAATFLQTDHVAVGGPNIAPAADGPIAACVANAPGGPVHVLLTDELAEHIPGCNMAFRADRLAAIGGFDPRFRAAGDDVDVCWRLQKRDWTIGFSPGAMVWHHRRNSIRAYWKQQQGYGKAEALLERKWPDRYNVAGHLTWSGRLYGTGFTRALMLRRGAIYQGTWGSALFQSLYAPAPGLWVSLPLMPEWWLAVLVLGALTLLGFVWSPLLVLWVPTLLFVLIPVLQATISASRARFPASPALGSWGEGRLRAVTALLHLIQPIARLRGRLRWGLTPWRRRGDAGFGWPLPRRVTLWNEQWRAPDAWLGTVETRLQAAGSVTQRGGPFDRWDQAVRGGLLGSGRLLMAIEEHGAGKQLVRVHIWPRFSPAGVLAVFALAILAALAAGGGVWVATLVLAAGAGALALMSLAQAGAACRALQCACEAAS